MNARGKISFITILMILGIVAGIFYAINYGPAYIDHGEVKQLAQQTLNRAQNKEWPDDRLVELFIEKTNSSIGDHVETDRFGKTSVQHGLGLTKKNVQLIRDNVRNMITVQVDYERVINLWPMKKQKTLAFHILKEGPTK